MDKFENYIKSKMCLYKMVNQTMTTYITINDAKKYGINIENDYFNVGEYVDVCHHNFLGNGLLAWDYLGIKKNYISHEELWELEGKLLDEKKLDNEDYEEKFLKICVLLIDMTLCYYQSKLSKSAADKMGINYDDLDINEENNTVNVCSNLCESAGESVWNLLGIEKDIIGISFLYKKRYNFCDELLKKQKVKKIYKKI